MKHKIKVLVLSMLMLGTVAPSKAGGIPVIDITNIVQTTATALHTLETVELFAEELGILEEQIRGIADLIGENGLELVLEKLEEEWGTETMIDVISNVDPDSPSFLDDVNDILETTLGGIALDDGQIEGLLADAGVDAAESSDRITDYFVELRNRDALFKQGIYAASQADARRAIIQGQIETAKGQLSGLGEKSQVASTQFIGETNLLLANQNQEMLALMARLLAKQGESDMMSNMDELTDREKFYEGVYALKTESGFDDVDYSETHTFIE